MKKITFYLSFLLCALLTYGQQSISFESSEGFALGELNGQNNWTVTGCGDGCFVENQAISNAQATDGDFSLRISQDPAFTAGQQVFGGFYNSPTIIDYRTAILSFDIFIDTEGFSDFRFGAVGPDGVGDLFFAFLIDFDFLNNIKVPDNDANFTTVGTWAENTWYNVRAELTETEVTYFIDNIEVGTYNLLNQLDITTLRFTNDNYGGNAFVDNLEISDTSLSSEEFAVVNDLTFYYNENSKSLVLKSLNNEISNVEIFTLLGQPLINDNRELKSNKTIDLADTSSGVYLVTATVNNKTKSFKFLKK